MSIGNRLREFGLKKFGKLKLLAEALDISPSNLQKYLNDERELTTSHLQKLHELECNVSWLLLGKYESFKQDDDLKSRIEKTIIILAKKFGILIKDLSEEISEYSNRSDVDDPERMRAVFIIDNWYSNANLKLIEIAELSRLAEVPLFWLMTGEYSLQGNYLEGLYLSYPEIQLLVMLKNDPALFEEIKNYVYSKRLKRIEKDIIEHSSIVLHHTVSPRVENESSKQGIPDQKK